MRVKLAYGRTGLEVDLPDDRTDLIEPIYVEGAADPEGVLLQALRDPVEGPPLADIVRPGQQVAIAICDGTRAQPRREMVSAILTELAGVVDPRDVTLFVATGTHRANTDAELRDMLGGHLVDTVRIVNHDARDDSTLLDCGVHGNGVPVKVNAAWLAADVRITTGFVEPHFFAGFSGGPKLVVPGLAGLETVLTLHDASRIGSPDATWGVIEGNPVHDDIRAVVAAVGKVDFALDVVMNRDQQIVQAFAGELFAMHRVARAAASEMAMRPVPQAYDVVVTTNAGYPLDQNLYQAVKGMSAAAGIVRDGGVIVCAAECSDGFPDHGSFRDEVTRAPNVQAALAEINGRTRTVPDQWQVQVEAMILDRARVIMHTGFLSDADLAAANLEQTDDVERCVRDLLAAAGDEARCCVLPEGPLTIPYLAEPAVSA